ncbi:hypothetical protein TrVE_jg7744 [Triparma verrucosa]|uniref:CW-type domain-containing protein n=1 Tax=Triparma verrucosa TaxID=1606542 RepID=A0A9W7B7U4_9STRA|nr:hypothetical protein TrVE_jg7744 [Triparma verrucosa]
MEFAGETQIPQPIVPVNMADHIPPHNPPLPVIPVPSAPDDVATDDKYTAGNMVCDVHEPNAVKHVSSSSSRSSPDMKPMSSATSDLVMAGGHVLSESSSDVEQPPRDPSSRPDDDSETAAPKKPNSKSRWTPEQDAALLKGVDDYGPDFPRIRDENSILLAGRTDLALEARSYKLKQAQDNPKQHLNVQQTKEGATKVVTWDEYLQSTSEGNRLILEKCVEHNKTLYLSMGKNFDHGLRPLQIPIPLCQRFLEGLMQAYEDGRNDEQGRFKHNELVLCPTEMASSTRELPPISFSGFDTYNKIVADHDAAAQRKYTTMLRVTELPNLVKYLDGFKGVYDVAKSYAGGFELLDMHVLQQSSAQAIFSWHVDTEQSNKIVLSQVFNLTPTKTSMQVAGYNELEYGGQGSGKMFLSNAHHRSGYAEDGTVKIAFFWGYVAYSNKRDTPNPTYPVYWSTTDKCHYIGCHCAKRRRLKSTNMTAPRKQQPASAAASLGSSQKKLLFEYDTVRCEDCFRWCHYECCNIDVADVRDVVGFSCKDCHNKVTYGEDKETWTKPATPEQVIVDSDEEEDDDKELTEYNIRAKQKASIESSISAKEWIQCSECEKWRSLPSGKLASRLLEDWKCSDTDWLKDGMKWDCSGKSDEGCFCSQALFEEDTFQCQHCECSRHLSCCGLLMGEPKGEDRRSLTVPSLGFPKGWLVYITFRNNFISENDPYDFYLFPPKFPDTSNTQPPNLLRSLAEVKEFYPRLEVDGSEFLVCLEKLAKLGRGARELREVYGGKDEREFICPLCPNSKYSCEMKALDLCREGMLFPLDRERFKDTSKQFPSDQFDVLRSQDGHYQITQFSTQNKYFRLGDWREFGVKGLPAPPENRSQKIRYKPKGGALQPVVQAKKKKAKRPRVQREEGKDEDDIYETEVDNRDSGTKTKTKKASKARKTNASVRPWTKNEIDILAEKARSTNYFVKYDFSADQIVALLRGVNEHGQDWGAILKAENEELGARSDVTIEKLHAKLLRQRVVVVDDGDDMVIDDDGESSTFENQPRYGALKNVLAKLKETVDYNERLLKAQRSLYNQIRGRLDEGTIDEVSNDFITNKVKEAEKLKGRGMDEVNFYEDVKKKTSLSSPAKARSTKSKTTARFSVGERVLSRWWRTKRHFPGKISKVHGDGTYAVEFDDGDISDRVKVNRIIKSCDTSSTDDEGSPREASKAAAPKKPEKPRKPKPSAWTLEQDAALLKGVDDYGLDFDRIRDESTLLANRTSLALGVHFGRLTPDKLRELRAAAPVKRGNPWTPEQDAALLKGVDDYGLDFDRIKDEHKDLLESRKVSGFEKRLKNLAPDKLRELRAAAPVKRGNPWTPEQDAALLKGVDDYGLDFDRIRENSTLLVSRSDSALENRFRKLNQAQRPAAEEVEMSPKKRGGNPSQSEDKRRGKKADVEPSSKRAPPKKWGHPKKEAPSIAPGRPSRKRKSVGKPSYADEEGSESERERESESEDDDIFTKSKSKSSNNSKMVAKDTSHRTSRKKQPPKKKRGRDLSQSDDESSGEKAQPIPSKEEGIASSKKGQPWNRGDISALEEGMRKHGSDWDAIWTERKDIFGSRNVRALLDKAYNLSKEKEKEKEKESKNPRPPPRIRGGGGDSVVDGIGPKRAKMDKPVSGLLPPPVPPASPPTPDLFKEHRFFPLATQIEHGYLKREFNERFWELRVETDRFYFYHFDSESEFCTLADARRFANTIVEYTSRDSTLCLVCAKIDPATTRLQGHRGSHLKRKSFQDPYEKRRNYPLANREKNPNLDHEFPAEHWVVRKLEKSGHAFFRHLASGREFGSTNDARKFAKTMSYYSPPLVIPNDPFSKRRELPLIKRFINTKISGEFSELEWEVRCNDRSRQFYLKHLESGKEFMNMGEARTLALTLPSYVAPVYIPTDPFAKRRNYPVLDRIKNFHLSDEFPAEFWDVRKQPLSGHCYFKHLQSGAEFIRPEDARGLAMTLEYYSPPPALSSNPAVKFRNLPLLARPLQPALSDEFPEIEWEVRRSLICQCYFKHLKTETEFSRISDARAFNNRVNEAKERERVKEKWKEEEIIPPMDVSVSSSSMESSERRAYSSSFDTTGNESREARAHTISMDNSLDSAVPSDVEAPIPHVEGMDEGRIRGGGGRGGKSKTSTKERKGKGGVKRKKVEIKEEGGALGRAGLAGSGVGRGLGGVEKKPRGRLKKDPEEKRGVSPTASESRSLRAGRRSYVEEDNPPLTKEDLIIIDHGEPPTPPPCLTAVKKDKEKKIMIGSIVYANYAGLGTFWPGKVKTITKDKDGRVKHVCVVYDDGDVEEAIKMGMLVLYEKTKAGTEEVSEGVLAAATKKGQEKKTKVKVKKVAVTKAAKKEAKKGVLQPSEPTPLYKVKEKVEVAWRGKSDYFKATITKVNSNNRWAVKYDDGEREDNVKAAHIAKKGAGRLIPGLDRVRIIAAFMEGRREEAKRKRAEEKEQEEEKGKEQKEEEKEKGTQL